MKNIQNNALFGVWFQENWSEGQSVRCWADYSFVKRHNVSFILQTIFRKVVQTYCVSEPPIGEEGWVMYPLAFLHLLFYLGVSSRLMGITPFHFQVVLPGLSRQSWGGVVGTRASTNPVMLALVNVLHGVYVSNSVGIWQSLGPLLLARNQCKWSSVGIGVWWARFIGWYRKKLGLNPICVPNKLKREFSFFFRFPHFEGFGSLPGVGILTPVSSCLPVPPGPGLIFMDEQTRPTPRICKLWKLFCVFTVWNIP